LETIAQDTIGLDKMRKIWLIKPLRRIGHSHELDNWMKLREKGADRKTKPKIGDGLDSNQKTY